MLVVVVVMYVDLRHIVVMRGVVAVVVVVVGYMGLVCGL